MVVLSLMIAVMVVVVYMTESKNVKLSQTNILYPFTGQMESTGEVKLLNSTGGPQIDCSAASGKNGGKVNIVGSFTEVIDSYGTCSPHSADLINATCGIPGSKINCKIDKDCGSGMSCKGGFCAPSPAVFTPNLPGHLKNTVPSPGQCGGVDMCPIQPGTACTTAAGGGAGCNDPNGNVMTCVPSAKGSAAGTCQVIPGKNCMGINPKHNTCASFPMCSNAVLGATVLNKTCAYSNKENKCRPRDSSAYLANACDGKVTCGGKFDLGAKDSPFGPLPCVGGDMSTLPIIPGHDGNFAQGYYVHGLYTCIPDE